MRWEIEIRHKELGKYRHIRGPDRHVVEQKATAQKQQWNEQWQRKQEAAERAKDKEKAAKIRAAEKEKIAKIREKEQKEHKRKIQDNDRLKKQTALDKMRQKEEKNNYTKSRNEECDLRNAKAKSDIAALNSILNHTLEINDAIDWNKLKDRSKFKEPSPVLEIPPSPDYKVIPPKPTADNTPPIPQPRIKPVQPKNSDPKYMPNFGILDKMIRSLKERKIANANLLFQKDHSEWVTECARLDNLHTEEVGNWKLIKVQHEEKKSVRLSEWSTKAERIQLKNEGEKVKWEESCRKAHSTHQNAIAEWEKRKDRFDQLRNEKNEAINAHKKSYAKGDVGAIAGYCEYVLSGSIYPDYFPKEWDLDYVADTRILILEYKLPPPDSLPKLKEVRYIQSRDDFKEFFLSDKEQENLYDGLLYQIALRTIHELFEADVVNMLDAVVFNGIVTALSKATGQNATACVLSVFARKADFLNINLAGIDPKVCFKNLKGVAASKLTGLSPVPPVMMINKDDRRFVGSYGVANYLDESINLAAMDWEDFEHLIRELFEQEFVTNGGEVKVTQASRDGGVDAVAFDPDPIRGGKIVIQAKRYSNTVGISAVRDLYGTVMNEGAIKGILVTTADFGPDAYEFANGKPLALLNGSNLLFLLDKHGYHAKINLNEARIENKNALLNGIYRKRSISPEKSTSDPVSESPV